MAKKRKASSSKSQPKFQNTSSNDVRMFLKGMIKDPGHSFVQKDQWSHARNAINNSVDGDLGLIGNEPANLLCASAPYPIIGAIHTQADKWVIFSTNDNKSEIGLFDDSQCTYTKLVNDDCLSFNRKHLIVGAAKENFDCTWQVYWDDGNNPSRTMNIDDIPWKQVIVSTPGDDCVIYEDTGDLDCEKLRLAPLVKTPCVEISKSVSGGQLRNGSYQVFIAYTVNEQRVTDYIGVSNVQSLFDHNGSSGSISVKVSNLDTQFDYYELVILSNNQENTVAKKIGLYSTEQFDIEIDYIDQALVTVPLRVIPLRSPAYEKSEAMYVVNDYLLRQGPTEQFDFNYQPIANQIKVKWVVAEYDSAYYYKGGNKTGFMRDEQYAFFIRWIYNTGERSSSYHIPGRAPRSNGRNQFNETVNETALNFSDNALYTDEYNFQVYNTATVTNGALSIPTGDGGDIIAKGDMGYWESTERYPATRPEIWGDLCGKPIRHHKMPTEEHGFNLRLSTPDGKKIRILGVEFYDIKPPLDNDGNIITNIVGYEILRGSREGHRSILAKGIFRNMRVYDIPDSNPDDIQQGLYPNYPYNDLRPDVYFHTGNPDPDGEYHRTDGCEGSFTQSKNNYPPLAGYKKDYFTFHSPELMFRRPFLNAYETRIYGEVFGKSEGYFIKSENHPQNILLRNGVALIAGLVGIGYAIHKVQGTQSKTKMPVQVSNRSLPQFVGFTNSVGYDVLGAAGAAGLGGVSAAGSFLLDELLDNLTDVADLYTGGTISSFVLRGKSIGNYLTVAAVPGAFGGGLQESVVYESPDAALPSIIRTVLGLIIAQKNIAIGAQEIVDLFYNFLKEEDFAFKHNSHGFYNGFKKRLSSQLFRTKNLNSNYIGSTYQIFEEYKINNLFRPMTVALRTEEELDNPSVIDKSRYTVGGDATSDFGNTYMKTPNTRRTTNISAIYGALKFEFENQYGQLDGIKQVQMRGCVELVNITNPNQKFTSSPIFAGDVYVNRYTEKTIMPIFADFLNGQPDQYTYDYLQRVNIPYPRFWMDTRKFDTSELATEIITLSFADTDQSLPNDLFYLDRGSGTCRFKLSEVFDSDGLNSTFAMRHAYMYTHVNGIQDFFVESEYNLAHRDWEDQDDKRHYDFIEYGNVDDMFHADIIDKGNFYKYDLSLSISKMITQLSSFGNVQPRDYDPTIAENCYMNYPKRLLYSLQAQKEAKKDFWRVFLANNYKDFKNKVSSIKSVNKSGAIIFFPYQSPQMFQGVDQLQTDLGVKITVGDGGLFQQPLQNIVNSDLSHEYGSVESIRAVANTPSGLFFMSQAQGKIFQYAGKLDNIANVGMKQWFNKYLPSVLIRQFPPLENSKLSDNPVIGIGCQVIYDPNYDIVYFCKKDFKVKEEFMSGPAGRAGYVSYANNQFYLNTPSGSQIAITIGDSRYFDNASWTVSYDPKIKAWISFHDWHPELVMPSINHFFTTISSTSGAGRLSGEIWRHNYRCDLYSNFYGIDYPWEIEITENTFGDVNTLRSIEYQLESYVYKGDLYNGCSDDRWHDLDFNFDEAIIHNSEQISGLLKLNLSPKEDPYGILQYPIINPGDIQILYSKEEQKYRFNQFWDITDDRGEFNNIQRSQFITQLNGYIKDLNAANLNYSKESLQHKKFRHYYNKVLLRRRVSGDRKMLMKLVNSKLNYSFR